MVAVSYRPLLIVRNKQGKEINEKTNRVKKLLILTSPHLTYSWEMGAFFKLIFILWFPVAKFNRKYLALKDAKLKIRPYIFQQEILVVFHIKTTWFLLLQEKKHYRPYVMAGIPCSKPIRAYYFSTFQQRDYCWLSVHDICLYPMHHRCYLKSDCKFILTYFCLPKKLHKKTFLFVFTVFVLIGPFQYFIFV